MRRIIFLICGFSIPFVLPMVISEGSSAGLISTSMFNLYSDFVEHCIVTFHGVAVGVVAVLFGCKFSRNSAYKRLMLTGFGIGLCTYIFMVRCLDA